MILKLVTNVSLVFIFQMIGEILIVATAAPILPLNCAAFVEDEKELVIGSGTEDADSRSLTRQK